MLTVVSRSLGLAGSGAAAIFVLVNIITIQDAENEADECQAERHAQAGPRHWIVAARREKVRKTTSLFSFLLCRRRAEDGAGLSGRAGRTRDERIENDLNRNHNDQNSHRDDKHGID